MPEPLRGPFESDSQFQQFKLAMEEETADIGRPVRVEKVVDAEGRIFARIVPLAGTPHTPSEPVQPVVAPPRVNPDVPPAPPVPGLDGPDPPPPGPAGPFVAARRTLQTTVLYIDAAGREMLRAGGSRSWRNNNPGNIRKGDFARNAGAIGDDGAFAIFADHAAGFAALIALLKSAAYASRTLRDAIFRYAPPSENDSERYLRFVADRTGIGPDQVLGTLPIAQLRRLGDAIQAMEGWNEGAERPNLPASGTPLRSDAEAGGVSGAAGAAREWMVVAEREAALPERERSPWPDPEENPRILEYFRVGAAWHEPSDETDWCAAFVNWCLVMSGHLGTDHPGARSFFWNRKGQFVVLDGPRKGAIAVRRYAPFDDPRWEEGKGHVGFVTSFTDRDVTLLGGNQSRTVRVQTYPLEARDSEGRLLSRFVAFLMPVMN